MSKYIFARPVSCVHDSEVTYSIDDDYSDPLVLPLFACGCRAVVYDMSRAYRPPSPEVIDLTSDDTIPLSDAESVLDIDEILDLVNDRERRVAEFHEHYIEQMRVAINNCLSEPYILKISTWSSLEPEHWPAFMDQHPTCDVEIDWVIVRRRTFSTYHSNSRSWVRVPFTEQVDIVRTRFELNYTTLCNRCAFLPSTRS